MKGGNESRRSKELKQPSGTAQSTAFHTRPTDRQTHTHTHAHHRQDGDMLVKNGVVERVMDGEIVGKGMKTKKWMEDHRGPRDEVEE